MVAIVAVRTFGIARPFFRYLERLVSHDAALDDLAVRRTSVYAALVPLTPARLGRRSRSSVLTGVVDDLTDVVEAQVRVTVPLISSALAGLVAVLLTAWFAPAVGLVLAGLSSPSPPPAGWPGCSSYVLATSCSSHAPRCCGSATSWRDRPASCRPSGVRAPRRTGWRRRTTRCGGRCAGRAAAARWWPPPCSSPPPPPPWPPPTWSTRPSRAHRSRRCSSSCRSPSARPWRRWSTRCAPWPGPRAAVCASTPCSTRSRP